MSSTTFTPGTRLGSFEIVDLLGVGGMGEVYRATDTNLKRQVAIKVLPTAVAADADRLARFQREAEVLAALNHPNIAHIFGLEKADRTIALVMELIEGPTLADRIAQGAIPIADVLPIAKQIAVALEAAHTKGIIHRDLKPANIKVTSDGNVKLLDFGLAKAFGDEASDMAGNPSFSPTMSPAGATAAGMIIGTAAYMSPEQARGKLVDARSDIWAFGCVLYEMLTGRKIFPGDTIADVLAAVVRAEPDWIALPDTTPSTIRTLLRRCLQKDANQRLHHIADARLELEDVDVESKEVAKALTPVSTSGGWMRALPWTLVALSLGLAAVALRTRAEPSSTLARPLARLELSLPDGVQFYSSSGRSVAIAPDGLTVAFIGVKGAELQAYVRRLDGDAATTVGNINLGASAIAMSPDGLSVAVSAGDGTIRRAYVKDGVLALVGGGNASTLDWGADRIAFTREGTLWQLPAGGGDARQVTTLDKDQHETAQEAPLFITGSPIMLFSCWTERSAGPAHMEAMSLGSGKRRIIIERAVPVAYALTGHLVFLRDGSLMAAPFDLSRLELTGSPVVVVENVATTASGSANAALSQNGTLVYVRGSASQSRLVWVSRQGLEQAIGGATENLAMPRLTSDGRTAVFSRTGEGLRRYDMGQQTSTPLTIDEPRASYPAATRDGALVIYRSISGLRRIRADGNGRSEPIPGTSENDYPSSFTPDGGALAFTRISTKTSADVYLMSTRGDPAPRPLLDSNAYESGAQFSPDGRWLAYASDESGERQVYVQPYPGLDRKLRISPQGGTHVLWTRGGRELVYRSGDKMLAVEFSAKAGTSDASVSAPTLLFDRPYGYSSARAIASYDVSPDGERFLMVKETSTTGRLNVVLNWTEELKRLVPTR